MGIIWDIMGIILAYHGISWDIMGIIWDIMGYTLSCHQTWRKKHGDFPSHGGFSMKPMKNHLGHRYRKWVLVQSVQVSSDMCVYIYICIYIYIYICIHNMYIYIYCI